MFAPPLYSTSGTRVSRGSLPAVRILFLLAVLYASGVNSAETGEPAKGKAVAAPVKKTVLVMFPHQIDLPVNVIAMQAIREEFEDAADLKLDVYHEYLDLNRFSEPAYQQKVFGLFADKYKSKPVDVVILVTERMLNLWLAQRAAILPNTPIVFCDVTTERLEALKLPADVTGVGGVLDYTKSAQWVLDKLPTINEIVVVHGVGQADQEYIRPVQALQEKMKGQLKFTDLSNLPLSVIKQRVADLPKSSVVVYALMFEDAAGVKHLPINALRELAAVSAVPVISGYDALIGTGSIGGYVYSYDHQAREAAQLSLRILRGEAVSAIPIIKGQANHFVFDQLALQRFSIPLSALPPDSIIKNKQYSAWELHRTQIIAVLVVFSVLLLLVAFLVIVTRRLNASRLALIRLNADLETNVQERTITLSQTNRNLESEITERKLADHHLRQSQQRFQALFDRAPEGILIIEATTGALVLVNAAFAAMQGYTVAEMEQMRLADLDAPESSRQLPERMRRVLAGETITFEVEHYHKAGHILPLEVTASLITHQGKLLVQAFHRDITARKQTEAVLRASLAEKTVLLKEVHHRVKNNLQIVSSLLDLQQRRTQDDLLLDTLASTRNRVRSMALIHEKLYQSDNLANLDLVSYLADLCRQLHGSAGNLQNRVRIESAVTPQNLAVGLDQALPCGLVINELVSNALKYAFPGERSGRIRVTLERPKPQEVLLTVADDGVGLPAALDPGHTGSLGLKLVFLLTGQLHGTVTFERASGTAVQIRFPNPSDTTP